MDKSQKQVTAYQLKKEKKAINDLKDAYEDAIEQIDQEIQRLMGPGYELTQSKVYQIAYQKQMKAQLEAILDKMNANNYQTISEYINGCYEDGWLATFYNIKGQGIPIVAPIDQDAVLKAVSLDSKLSKPLYEQMGINVNELKKSIAGELSRGLASGLRYEDISRNIANQMGIDLNKSIRIARTEGHRVTCQANMDAMNKAKDQGADVVKQWDSTMDKKTRPSHQRVDGEIRELDEKFSNGLMHPGDPAGTAAEVVNCRCVLLERARWALDEAELEELKQRAEYFGIDKSESYEEFKQKYLKAETQSANGLDPSKGYKRIYKNKEDADKKFRKWADETTYALGDKDGQYAIWDYTSGSGNYNRPLSGFKGSWYDDDFVGVGKVDLDYEGAGKYIEDLTRIINNTKPLDYGVTLRRGSSEEGLIGLFRNAGFDAKFVEKTMLAGKFKDLKGTPVLNTAFTSCGIAKNAGFTDETVEYIIKCPAGTKMIYAEPQSYYGGTMTGNKWSSYTPGKSYSEVRDEAEMIIQRNTYFTIDEIKKTYDGYSVIMTVIGQD